MANPAESIIGGLLIELCFAFMLYGITTLQTFIYFQKYSTDRFPLKALVAAVWILECIHTAFCMQFIYSYLVVGFGDYPGFVDINWGIGITVLCSAGIAMCVQGYYTWRVWIVSGKSLVWTVVIGFFVLLRVVYLMMAIYSTAAFGIASAALSYIYPNWMIIRYTKSTLITISGGLGSAALVDMLVALTLSYYLKRGKHIWHGQSNSMVNRILLYAVNTGAITGTASLLCVILFALEKSSLVFLGLVMIQAKLYANSFLGSLNARSHIRRKGSLGGGYSASSSSGYRAPSPRIPVVEVFQHTDVLDDRDNPPDDSSYNMESIKGAVLA
ncbi:hypothetical protein BC628DRAFT_1414504 [Trametes gibbosa]|nr:hypothetical protein BC628DRAFT_1414504 [Trametes gibbosa]